MGGETEAQEKQAFCPRSPDNRLEVTLLISHPVFYSVIPRSSMNEDEQIDREQIYMSKIRTGFVS